MDTLRQSLICGKSRTSVVVQFVQAFQVANCGYLQEIEIEIASITKIGGNDGGRNAFDRPRSSHCGAASSSSRRTRTHLLWPEQS
jgi:hypothetical protein